MWEEIRSNGSEAIADEMVSLVKPWSFHLQSIRIQADIWWGELDSFSSPIVGQRMSSMIPNSRLRLEAGAGHLIPLHALASDPRIACRRLRFNAKFAPSYGASHAINTVVFDCFQSQRMQFCHGIFQVGFADDKGDTAFGRTLCDSQHVDPVFTKQ